MTETLLGCPHCSKPVGFALALASQVVGCPHCQEPFQMPDRPPLAPAKPHVAPPIIRPEPSIDKAVATEISAATAHVEPTPYRVATRLATVFAVLGSATLLIGLAVVTVTIIVPRWRGEADGFLASVQGLLWLIVAILFAAIGLVALFLIRAFVLVAVDAARTLRDETRRGGRVQEEVTKPIGACAIRQ